MTQSTTPETSSLSLLPDEPKLGPGTLATVSQALDSAVWIAGHGIAGDLTELVSAGVPVKEEWVRGEKALDSLLLARMQDENDLSYELENLALSKFDIEPWKHKTKAYDWEITEVNGKKHKRKSIDARRWPVTLRRERCAMDAWAARLLVQELYDPKTSALIAYTHRTAALLERVNVSGAVVDLNVLDELDTTYRLARDQNRDELTKLAASAGVDGFSPTNDNHIRDLLFHRLGLVSLSKTPGGEACIDKHVLKQLTAGGSDAVRLLLAFNRADKLYTVNVSGVRRAMGVVGGSNRLDGVLPAVPTLPYIQADDIWMRSGASWGYLPFRINPLGARTGRRSSTKPNAQNWPEAVRGMVRSRWPEGLILNADYKKLEVVLIAWIAGDDKLLTYFTKGRGYQDVAKELFGYEVESGTPMYTAVKSIVLGVHYNMQTPKMARQLWSLFDEKTKSYPCRLSADRDEHERITGKLRSRYLARFVGIGRYMEEREASWRKTGVSCSYTQRVRHLPVPDRQEEGYGHMLNQAINFPIQSLASDVTASAMIDFEAAMLYEAGLKYVDYLTMLLEQRKFLTSGGKHGIIPTISQIINEVHDSVVVDLYPGTSKRDQEILLDCMRSVRSLKKLAPGFDASILDADVKINSHWRSK